VSSSYKTIKSRVACKVTVRHEKKKEELLRKRHTENPMRKRYREMPASRLLVMAWTRAFSIEE